MSESCSTCRSTTKRPLQPHSRMTLLASLSAALVLSSQPVTVHCFGGVKSTSFKASTRISGSSSALQFRNAIEEIDTTTFSAAATLGTEFLSTKKIILPTWLAIDRSRNLDENMNKLTSFMRDSYFTEHEILQLSNAIYAASAGDGNIASGAAEFCLLLAETIDMGLYALTAGAIHYCTCARNRQRGMEGGATSGLFGSTSGESAKKASLDLQNYGSHVLDIVTDAGRLKQLEMVAASVMQQQGSRERQHDAENLRHLLLTETKDWRALAIRTAASLFRLRGILAAAENTHQPVTLTKESIRAAREAFGIYAPLASSLGMHRLKNELEGAAFKILYRRQYEAVHSLRQRKGAGTFTASTSSTVSDSNIGASMQRVLEDVKSEMTAMFQDDDEFTSQLSELSITTRVKEPYSMWLKMRRAGYSHVLQVPDALALRIVLKAKRLSPDEPADVTIARERALCYYAQKRCQERWQPLASSPRFKDYIARPKKNGYQSLHYTGQTWWQGEPWTLEVQVRSAAMHQVAEFGLACHWDYKAATKKGSNNQKEEPYTVTISDVDNSSDSYLRNVQQYWRRRDGIAETNMATLSEQQQQPAVLSEMWESRERADRIRARTERLQPYLQALTATQSDLARERVFVFMTTAESKAEHGTGGSFGKSKVLALPSGACVLDALREGERTMKVGPLMSTAWVNGQESSITKQLHNGDILKFSLATSTVSA